MRSRVQSICAGVLASLAALACGVRQTPFELRLASEIDRNELSAVHIQIQNDTSVVYQTTTPFPPGAVAPVPRLGRSTYTIEVTLVSSSCRVVGRGSAELSFPLSEGQPAVVDIFSLSDQECATTWCGDLLVCQRGDSGLDSSLDARLDAGLDTALDSNPDVPMGVDVAIDSSNDITQSEPNPDSAGCPPSCSDGNLCNGIETCVNGSCVAGTPLVCPNNGLGCDGTETCNPALGCTTINVPSCADSVACTVDSCVEPGSCQNIPVNCPPANDLPASPSVIPGATNGMLNGDLTNATQQGSGCGLREVYYQWTLPTRSIIRLSTLGLANFDTQVAYRGGSCSNSVFNCGTSACGTAQDSLMLALNAGTYCFSVAVGSGAGSTFRLSYERMQAASGENIAISGSHFDSGILSQFGGNIAPTCTSATGTEDAYFFENCNAGADFSATTCTGNSGTLDTVLSLATPTGELFCNDDVDLCLNRSTIDGQLPTVGLYAVVVDAEAETGSYNVAISLQ